MKIDIWWHCCNADIAVHQMHISIYILYYTHCEAATNLTNRVWSSIHSDWRLSIYYIIIYYARREENKTEKKSYPYLIYIYYVYILLYARLTTGRVLFFHRPANTENPPAVDNRNIHHIYNSFPIDTFTYFYVEDKKNPMVLSTFFCNFSALHTPWRLPPSSSHCVYYMCMPKGNTIIVLLYIYAVETLFTAVLYVYLSWRSLLS